MLINIDREKVMNSIRCLDNYIKKDDIQEREAFLYLLHYLDDLQGELNEHIKGLNKLIQKLPSKK